MIKHYRNYHMVAPAIQAFASSASLQQRVLAVARTICPLPDAGWDLGMLADMLGDISVPPDMLLRPQLDMPVAAMRFLQQSQIAVASMSERVRGFRLPDLMLDEMHQHSLDEYRGLLAAQLGMPHPVQSTPHEGVV